MTQQLAFTGPDEATAEAHWILQALGISRLALRLNPQATVSPEQLSRAETIVARRQQREPLQYILGNQSFFGLELQVGPGVLIPRPETEELVERVLAQIPKTVAWRVLDMGTGSGAIALAIKAERPACTVVATDISLEALQIAQANGQALGLDVDFRLGNLLEPVCGETFQVMVSNPPYIPEADYVLLDPEVLQYEPRQALTPGADPLFCYRALAQEGRALLAPGGYLACELDSQLAVATAALFIAPWQEVLLHADLQGRLRFLSARAPAEV